MTGSRHFGTAPNRLPLRPAHWATAIRAAIGFGPSARAVYAAGVSRHGSRRNSPESDGAPSGWMFLFALFLLSALLVVACGDGDSATPVAPAPVPAPPPPPPPAPAPTPSRVPANLRVSASGEDFIEWTWDPVAGASGYRVQFSLDDDFTDADETIARAAAQNAYRRTLAPGAEAYLRVQSSFGAGDAVEFSEWSAPVPGRGSGVLGVPANLRVSASGEDFIEWSWDPVESVSGYRVQFSLDDRFHRG